MKKLIVLSLATALILLSGCGEEANSNDIFEEGANGNSIESSVADESSDFDESLRGEWIYVHNGEKVYIDENFDEKILKVDNTLLTIAREGVDYHLIRYGINTTVVTGNLYKSSSSLRMNRDASSVGNVNIVLKHYVDKKKDKKQTVSSTGEFTFRDVQTGSYTFEATTEDNMTVSADVDIYGEELSLGSFKLVSDNGYNFKTEYMINNSKGGYLFGDQTTYDGKLLIKNIGNKKGTGLNYTFSSDSPYISQMSADIVLGTVDVNKSIEIPFNVTFNILDKTTVSIPIDVTIKDANGNEWNDTLFVHVYQTPMYLNIATQKANIKGYIIDEAHQLQQIDTGDATIVLPYKAGQSYYLVLSNPNIDNETLYSIGLDSEALDFENFQDTSAYEPNNQESEATTLKMKESLISYLHEGDIDYYKLDMSSSEDIGLYSPPQMPFK